MKIKQAYLVEVGGTITRLPDLEGKELKLATMYPLISCDTIEHVGLGRGVDMWVDENGLFSGRGENHVASEMYRDAYPHIPRQELGIVGAVIVTDNTKAGNYIKKYE